MTLTFKQQLESKGFYDIKVDQPGSIQIAANHQLGVGVYFYSKHSVATLTVYDTPYNWTPDEFERVRLYDVTDFISGEEIDRFEYDLSTYKGGDMGGLLDDDKLLQVFLSLWYKYLYEYQPPANFPSYHMLVMGEFDGETQFLKGLGRWTKKEEEAYQFQDTELAIKSAGCHAHFCSCDLKVVWSDGTNDIYSNRSVMHRTNWSPT